MEKTEWITWVASRVQARCYIGTFRDRKARVQTNRKGIHSVSLYVDDTEVDYIPGIRGTREKAIEAAESFLIVSEGQGDRNGLSL